MVPRTALLALCLAVLHTQGAAAAGPDPANPDWPCVQRKVPTLTPAAIWTGPSIEDGALDWRADPGVAALVRRLSQRRLPLEEANAEIEAFAQEAGAARGERLTALFAGLFEVMDAERSEIIDGVERYARRQKDLADGVRTQAALVDEMRRSAAPDLARLGEAEAALLWQTRIFNDRRASMTYICEAPRLVEQRLFALGRTIGKAMRD